VSNSLVNKAKVREFAFKEVERLRPHRIGDIRQVSSDFYLKLDAVVRERIRKEIQNHHVGKTLGKGN